jgi:putative transposase
MTKHYRRSKWCSKGSCNRQRRAERKAARREIVEQFFQGPLDHEEFVAMARDTLHSFAVELGVLMAGRLLEDEVDRLCGPRYQWQRDRTRTRYGRQPGVVTMAGQKIPLRRPRVRTVSGRGQSACGGEVELETYALLQRSDAMPEACLKRMVRGVSCRDYEGVVERARDGFGIRRSSVSRGFVRASAGAVEQLARRRFEGQRFPAIFVDGIEYAGETLVVALGISQEGTNRILGLRQGATENAAVVTALLEDLAERGLETSRPTLFVLDGAKALVAAVKRVFGRQALIQRCQVHKKRNVRAHLAETHHPELSRRLSAAYAETDYNEALSKLRSTVTWLERLNPAAAASLREGLEETLTVVRLKLPQRLRLTLATTNPIESALSVSRTLTARVKRWRDGHMRTRWLSAALMRAEEKFRRVKGYREIPQLLAALDATPIDTKARAG